LRSHEENFPLFAGAVESIIKQDVQNYISELMKQQAKQEQEIESFLENARTVSRDQNLIARMDPNYQPPIPAYSPELAEAPAETYTTVASDEAVFAYTPAEETDAPFEAYANGAASYVTAEETEVEADEEADTPISAEAIEGVLAAANSLSTKPGSSAQAVATMKILKDTVLKLSAASASTLGEDQKFAIASGTTVEVLAYKQADDKHFYITFSQGFGPANRNTWYVYSNHVEVTLRSGQRLSITPPVVTPRPPASNNGVVKLAVPYLSQLDNSKNPFGSCNVTSIAMCLKYFGVQQKNPRKQFEDELQDWLEARGLRRHSPHDLVKAAEAYGCDDNFNSRATLEQLKQWLAQGNPAVVHGYFTNYGHIVCVIGYNERGLIVHDPYGEWIPGGYRRNDRSNPERGKSLTYSYKMIRETCMTGGEFWVHFISRPGHKPATKGGIQPIQLPKENRGNDRLITIIGGGNSGSKTINQLITAEQLLEIAGSSGYRERLRSFAPGVNETLNKFEINTPLRIAHFLAQIMHESGGFRYVREIWGPNKWQVRYEGRRDLGNTQPGDGKRFLGRGLIQLTGRANYEKFSKAIGVDCVAKPELVEQAPYAIMAAGWFWDTNNINKLADQDNLLAVTRRINGGTNGLDDRARYLKKAKAVLRA